MKLLIFQADAFASRVFAGNPAAVVILDQWLANETLQAIAQENNLSETAFVVPRADFFDLRWFTPTVEVDLCGHATLASAHVLFQNGFAAGDEIVFRSQAGHLTVRRDAERLAMDLPARPALLVEPDAQVAHALGARPRELHAARDLLAVFDTQTEVEALTPDFAAVAGLDTFAVVATAPGHDCDFVSRFFAPAQGVPEDPATGSAHCTLVPYWSKRLGKPKLHALQVSARGGELFCEFRGERVVIAGCVVDYLHGEIRI